MAHMLETRGEIIIGSGINVWPHELKTAEALAAAGYTVEFIKRSEKQNDKSADVRIDGLVWEMKAPKSGRTDMIQKNLRRALHQSRNVIFDSRRMKNLPDKAIEREVRLRANELKTLRRLIYVNRSGEVVVVR